MKSKFLVDPVNITKYDCTDFELELLALFWICAAGKNGITSARCLNDLLSGWCPSADMVKANPSPFDIIGFINHNALLAEEMRQCGIGCYNNKAKSFMSLFNARLNLKTCTVEDLEAIHGIGPKTARCFLIHSRPNQKYAGLDTHLLKFLRDKGHVVPKSTPTGKKYKQLESVFLDYVEQSGMSVADYDLQIWNYYRNKKAV